MAGPCKECGGMGSAFNPCGTCGAGQGDAAAPSDVQPEVGAVVGGSIDAPVGPLPVSRPADLPLSTATPDGRIVAAVSGQGGMLLEERQPNPPTVPSASGDEVLAAPAGDRAETLPTATVETATVASGTIDLTEVSREELYQRAQELDIPGRSDMKKEELADAVAEAESK